jgi:hypothetical protein
MYFSLKIIIIIKFKAKKKKKKKNQNLKKKREKKSPLKKIILKNKKFKNKIKFIQKRQYFHFNNYLYIFLFNY